MPLASSLAPASVPDKEVSSFGHWFHNPHLADGRQTAPDHFLSDFPSFKWREIAPCIASDLTGWKALDIGYNAGFYSLDLAKRGAASVTNRASEKR